ncbi:DUF4393 domain-containing protein [Streptococcus salivarius]
MVDEEDIIKIGKEIIPNIYDDGAKPAIKEMGNFIARPLKLINTLFQPLDVWLLNKEYNLEKTKVLLAERLKHVAENELVSPAPYVALPAIAALSYSMDSEELRDLYANLLSKAMVLGTKDKVHPSFVEIIKQLSPLDAIVFKEIMESSIKPIIDLYISNSDEVSEVSTIENITWLDRDYDIVLVALANLARLGLIEIPDGYNYNNDSNYDLVRLSSTYAEIYEKLNCKIKTSNMLNHEVKERKKYIKLNALSETFYKICVCKL